MIYILITLTILGFITCAASIFFAAYQFGASAILRKWTVESKRREKRLQRELFLCHNVIARKAGFGALTTTPPVQNNSDNQKTGIKIVSPREKITEMQEAAVLNNQVPPAIKERFLRDADVN